MRGSERVLIYILIVIDSEFLIKGLAMEEIITPAPFQKQIRGTPSRPLCVWQVWQALMDRLSVYFARIKRRTSLLTMDDPRLVMCEDCSESSPRTEDCNC